MVCFTNTSMASEENMAKAILWSIIQQNVHEALSNEKFNLSIFVDLKKTFDTVNFNILSNKLSLYENKNIKKVV